jgi:hypothetical protein
MCLSQHSPAEIRVNGTEVRLKRHYTLEVYKRKVGSLRPRARFGGGGPYRDRHASKQWCGSGLRFIRGEVGVHPMVPALPNVVETVA